jgi:hypothetical protein
MLRISLSVLEVVLYGETYMMTFTSLRQYVNFKFILLLILFSTTWRTIDKGLESLPRAFMPHVQNKTTFGRFVSGLTHNADTQKIAVNWREKGSKFSLETQSEDFDYAIVAVPFSKVRLWRTPREYLSTSILSKN